MPFGRKSSGDQSLIDRDPQNLPVMIGGLRVVRRNRRTSSSVKWWRANSPNLVAAIGLAAALGGAYMATSAPQIPAYVNESIFIGGHQLKPVADRPGVYTGDATFIWPAHGAVAAASTSVNGKDVAGRCVMSKPAGLHRIEEDCSFWIAKAVTDSPSFTSHDTYDLTASTPMWKRHYSDGPSVEITIPASIGGVVPVPLPVGR